MGKITGIFDSKQIENSLDYVSYAKLKALQKGERYFYSDYVLKEIHREENSRALTGKNIHAALFEPQRFKENYILLPDFGDQRSPKNRESKANYLNDLKPDAILVSESDMEAIKRSITNISAHGEAFALLRGGLPEKHVYAYSEEFDCVCYARPDFLRPDYTVVDFKTTQMGIDHDAIRKQVEQTYYLQMGFYLYVMELLAGREINDGAWVFSEQKPPFDVAGYYLQPEHREAGRNSVRKLLGQWQEMRIRDPEWKSPRGLQADGRLKPLEVSYWFAKQHNVGGILK